MSAEGLIFVGVMFTTFGLITILVARRWPHPYDQQPYRGSELDEVAASGRRLEHGIWVVTLFVGVGLVAVGLLVAGINWLVG